MKKILIVSFFFLSSVSLMAQNQGKKNVSTQPEVPAAVKTSFHTDFPTAAYEKWGKEDGNYEANFKIDNMAMSALYTKAGYRKEVEKEIPESKLPPAVFDYIKKNYPGAKLKTASQIVTDKAVVTYEAEITVNNKTKSLIFDSNGKYKKKE